MIRSARRKLFIRWLCAMAIALGSVVPVYAQNCTYSPAGHSFNFGFPGHIRVPSGAPNGTVLASTTMLIGYSCPYAPGTSWSFSYRSHFTSSSTVPGDLYLTNGGIQMGLGIRVTNLNTGQQMKNDRNQGFVQWMPSASGYVSGSAEFKLEIVKLNDMIYNPPPSLAAGLSLLFGEFRITNNNTLIANPVSIMWNNGPITIGTLPRSCSVTTGDTGVYLDKVRTSQLASPGLTAGDKAFTVGLRCSAGTNVYVTLTDMTDPGNMGNQLTLAPESTASGIKLRLLRSNGVPVSFGPDSSTIGNQNQWYLGASGSTTGIPLTAQYISTGPVKAGVVKGRASFTLSYQ